MTKSRGPRRPTGAVYLEFLIAFPSIWTLCLYVFQLVLLARADLVVRHAAESAARSAAVVLPDDPALYRGEPKMSVSREPRVDRKLAAPKRADPSSMDILDFVLNGMSLDGRSRRETIAAAAEVPLLSLGATPRAGKLTVHSAIGPTRFASSLASARAELELSFPDTVEERVRGPEVTVRVNFTYHCSVPIARHIICERDPNAQGDRVTVWPFEHSTTVLVHDAPYSYRSLQES